MKRLLILVVFLVACGGGGGGGSDDKTPSPEILNAAFYTYSGEWVESIYFEHGDVINFIVSAIDIDMNMEKLFIQTYKETDSELIPIDLSELILSTQSEAEMRYFLLEPYVMDWPEAYYRVCFYIVDGDGNESNEFCVNILVY